VAVSAESARGSAVAHGDELAAPAARSGREDVADTASSGRGVELLEAEAVPVGGGDAVEDGPDLAGERIAIDPLLQRTSVVAKD
jgi:hypothetical protein